MAEARFEHLLRIFHSYEPAINKRPVASQLYTCRYLIGIGLVRIALAET